MRLRLSEKYGVFFNGCIITSYVIERIVGKSDKIKGIIFPRSVMNVGDTFPVPVTHIKS